MNRYFVTGKGGVGKSTVSAALALFLSRHAKTLLISLDPTQSLATIFQRPVSDREAPLRDNLYVKEIDPARYAETFKQILKTRIEKLRLTVSFDLDNYIDSILANPATREEVLVEYIMAQILREDFDNLVFDMAPSGSFFKTFSMMFALKSWVQFLRKQREKIAQLSAVVLKRKDDPILRELEELLDKYQQLREVISGARTQFLVVCNPGVVPAKETLSQIHFFETLKLNLKGVILNKWRTPQHWWELLEQAGAEFPRSRIRGYPEYRLPLMPEEPLGFGKLEILAGELEKQFPVSGTE